MGDALAARVQTTAYLRRERWRGRCILEWIDDVYHDAILAGTSTVDVTAAFEAAAAELADTALEGDAKGETLHFPAGRYSLSRSVTFRGIGLTLQGDGIAATVIVAIADIGPDQALLELRQVRQGYSQIGVSIRGGLRVDMAGHIGHGIRIWKPYDGVVVEPIKVDNVADDNHALMIVPDPTVTPGDPYSQTVMVVGVLAYHQNATATASLFYIEALNEAVFMLCKGFGTYYDRTSGGTVLPSLHPFELVDCNGVNLLNCSAALANEHGVLVRATSTGRLSRSVVIDTLTLELIRGTLKCLGASTVDDESMKVLEPELRSPRNVTPYYTHPDGDIVLSSVRGAVIDAKSLTVQMSDTDRCRVRSDGAKTNVSGYGTGDRIEFLPSQFSRTKIEVKLPSDQVVPSGSFTKVNFTSEVADVSGEWDAPNATGTVTKAGRLRIEARFGCKPTTSASGIIAGLLIVNGLEKARFFTRPVSAELFNDGLGLTLDFDLAAGDTYYVLVYADMGMTISSASEKTYMRITAVNNGYVL